MRALVASLTLAVAATPALAAGERFVSLRNTDFVVLLAFLLFVAVLVYFRVPGLLGGLLDKRADTIRAELDEAKALREEAQTVLARYERKMREVSEQSERIIAHAKEEARLAAEQSKEDIKASIARRLQGAEDQIASAESKAVKEVRDSAIQVAVAAARKVIAAKMTAAQGNTLIDEAIDTVEKRLH